MCMSRKTIESYYVSRNFHKLLNYDSGQYIESLVLLNNNNARKHEVC